MRPLGVWCAIACMTAAAAASAADPWHERLSYEGPGDYWPLRLPVAVTATGEIELNGVPVEVAVSKDNATSALTGSPVASLRVVTADGVELKFGLMDEKGAPKRQGKVAAGDVMLIPAEVPKNATAIHYIYAGNAGAWLPPEWLSGGLTNGSFEAGGVLPAGWQVHETDANHRMARQKGGAHAGDFCARCEVDAGTGKTWVKYAQSGLPVVPGRKYRFSAWVKAEGVEGRAGWYVHVHGDKAMLVNVTRGHEGTFGWRRIEVDFTVPEGGRTVSFGTVLHGTGKAWYDDVRLDASGEDVVRVKVLPAERRVLRKVPATITKPHLSPKDWPWRMLLRVRRFVDGDLPAAVVSVDARRIRNHAAKLFGFRAKPVLRVIDGASGQTLPLNQLTQTAHHASDVEAYEFWGSTWWTYDPWKHGWHWYIRQSNDGVRYFSVRYPNGDGFLAYPGMDGSPEPLPTIRLLAARDGVEDYEIFLALKQFAEKGNQKAIDALAKIRSLVNMKNRGGRYSTVLMPDPDAVHAARVVAGNVLSALATP